MIVLLYGFVSSYAVAVVDAVAVAVAVAAVVAMTTVVIAWLPVDEKEGPLDVHSTHFPDDERV